MYTMLFFKITVEILIAHTNFLGAISKWAPAACNCFSHSTRKYINMCTRMFYIQCTCTELLKTIGPMDQKFEGPARTGFVPDRMFDKVFRHFGPWKSNLCKFWILSDWFILSEHLHIYMYFNFKTEIFLINKVSKQHSVTYCSSLKIVNQSVSGFNVLTGSICNFCIVCEKQHGFVANKLVSECLMQNPV